MWSMSFIGENLRRGGSNWSDYWNQFLGKILPYPMPAKNPPDPIIYRTAKAHATKRLLLLGLMSASSKSASVTNIELSVERILKINLRKDRGKDVKLKICKLSDFEINQVISVLDIITSYLINKGETKPIILHTG